MTRRGERAYGSDSALVVDSNAEPRNGGAGDGSDLPAEPSSLLDTSFVVSRLPGGSSSLMPWTVYSGTTLVIAGWIGIDLLVDLGRQHLVAAVATAIVVDLGYLCLALAALRETLIGPARLELTATALQIVGPEGRIRRKVPYESIHSIDWYSFAYRRLVIHRREGFPIDASVGSFDSASSAERFRSQLLDRIRERPGGCELADVIERRSDEARSMLRRPPFATLAFAGGIVAVWILVWSVPESIGDEVFAMGATSRSGLAGGEIWRLLTPAFLHLGPGHLGVNLLTLVVLGVVVEGYLGRARFVLISGLSSAIGIAIVTAVAGDRPAAGASVGIMGIFGTLFVLNIRDRDILPGFARVPRFIAALAVAQLAAGQLLGGAIGTLAHVLGAIAGAVLAWLLPRRDAGSPMWIGEKTLGRLASAVVAIYGAAFVFVVWRSLAPLAT